MTITSGQPGSGPAFGEEPAGKTAEGAPVTAYTLTNKSGMRARILSYGGTVTHLTAPDRGGKFEDVVLGFDTVEEYQKSSPYFGCIVGRVANRIKDAKFTLDNKTYTVTGGTPHSLHGGKVGFDKRNWSGSPSLTPMGPAVALKYTSADGEEGFPGVVNCTVIYTLTNNNELRIDYFVTSNKATPLNITNHSYFNLAGAKSGGTILDHQLQLNADAVTATDAGLIPTGELQKVDGTLYDFRKPHAIGDRIKEIDAKPVGYDINYALTGTSGGEPRFGAVVTEPKSGRQMRMLTTEPGVQFYSGNFLDGTLKGKGGTVYPQYGALCLEAQHFPDSINQPKFPNTVLKPGVEYKQTTIYQFTVAAGN